MSRLTVPGPHPAPLEIGGRRFDWGARTFVMGIVNVTPDSFSGDGLASSASEGAVAEAALRQAVRMAGEGADLLDVGGESTRPGHAPVPADEEIRRVAPVIAALHHALPAIPISIDTTKPEVAARAIDEGASLINDVWGTREDDTLDRLAAARGVALCLMHNRAFPEGEEPRYDDLVGEVVAELRRAIERARAAGVPEERILVDPGFGFGKTPAQNLELIARLAELRILGRPILLGTSRKSTLGRVLGGVPAQERVEGTLATTALGIAAGADIVRVHDVIENVRAARVADAIVRVPVRATIQTTVRATTGGGGATR
jgi:dihydropteroate synthase